MDVRPMERENPGPWSLAGAFATRRRATRLAIPVALVLALAACGTPADEAPVDTEPAPGVWDQSEWGEATWQ